MMTHTIIAKRFKAGESVNDLAMRVYLGPRTCGTWLARKQYVEHAIRQVLKRQEGA